MGNPRPARRVEAGRLELRHPEEAVRPDSRARAAAAAPRRDRRGRSGRSPAARRAPQRRAALRGSPRRPRCSGCWRARGRRRRGVRLSAPTREPSSAARASRWREGTWSALVAAKATRSGPTPRSQSSQDSSARSAAAMAASASAVSSKAACPACSAPSTSTSTACRSEAAEIGLEEVLALIREIGVVALAAAGRRGRRPRGYGSGKNQSIGASPRGPGLSARPGWSKRMPRWSRQARSASRYRVKPRRASASSAGAAAGSASTKARKCRAGAGARLAAEAFAAWLGRPLGVALRQHRQVEQPFAGVVEQFQGDGAAAEQVAAEPGGALQGRGSARPSRGPRCGPARRAGRRRATPGAPARSKRGTACAAAGTSLTSRSRPPAACFERRQGAPPLPRRQQVGHQRGDEHRLAGAGQPGDGEAQALLAERRAAELLRGPGGIAEQPERAGQAEGAEQIQRVGHGRARGPRRGSAALDQLDLVAVRVLDEGDDGGAELHRAGLARDLAAALAHRFRRPRPRPARRPRDGRRRCPARSSRCRSCRSARSRAAGGIAVAVAEEAPACTCRPARRAGAAPACRAAGVEVHAALQVADADHGVQEAALAHVRSPPCCRSRPASAPAGTAPPRRPPPRSLAVDHDGGAGLEGDAARARRRRRCAPSRDRPPAGRGGDPGRASPA